ncbi:hypothetical protein [Ligilactobacillus salivarius]|uniref:hypothetical protein n=1 Tax=Ligilactobacillus salivarius TaxID=1624 RepID=UPI001F5BB10F|nr:hypothetical protein [Ligilactobacillus salivarius]
MDYMELFEPVDEVQTARNVRNFFNKDLDKLLRMANEVPSFLRSPVIDDMPKSPSFKNSSEEILVNHFESKSYIAKNILIDIRCTFPRERAFFIYQETTLKTS